MAESVRNRFKKSRMVVAEGHVNVGFFITDDGAVWYRTKDGKLGERVRDEALILRLYAEYGRVHARRARRAAKRALTLTRPRG